jgi:hypothetical protein
MRLRTIHHAAEGDVTHYPPPARLALRHAPYAASHSGGMRSPPGFRPSIRRGRPLEVPRAALAEGLVVMHLVRSIVINAPLEEQFAPLAGMTMQPWATRP